MAVLVDPPQWRGRGGMWSHLASDESMAALHRFAADVGIPARGFDRDHYDVPGCLYDELLRAGAQPVPSRELVRRISAAGLRRRKAGTLGRRAPGQPLLRPRRLRPGDRVRVVAPAGPVTEEVLAPGLQVLGSWGLHVELAPHVLPTDWRHAAVSTGVSPTARRHSTAVQVRGRHSGAVPALAHLAASDEDRAADLQDAWCDPDIAAVICARGGYGATRVLDVLDWPALMSAGPTVLAGFSDITALHQGFARVLGVATLHSPVVTSLGAGDACSREHLRRTLFEPETALDLVQGGSVRTVVGGKAEGVLVGGNLALLAAEAGGPTSRPARGGIAMLEDHLEPPYRIDRMLTQLLRSGWFAGVAGIAVGEFTRCGRADDVRAVLEDRLAPLGVPVLAGLPFGHGATNLTVALGVKARLDADAGELALSQPALA